MGKKMGRVERTPSNPIFVNDFTERAVKKAARKWAYEIKRRGIDSGKDIDDLEGDMYVLWCESCIRHKDQPEELVYSNFEKNVDSKLDEYIKQYFKYIEGRPETGIPDPFEPDYYQFTELYRNGHTIDDLAEHYGVSRDTIKRYMGKNFVTKQPIDPQLYLDCHEKLHGRDASYWNIRSELITRFEVD